MVVLFDCDGTLFLSDDARAQRAMVRALEDMTGEPFSAAELDELDHQAQCARWIAREAVRRRSLPPIDLAAWAARVEELYLADLPPPEETDWDAPARTGETLDDLRRDGFRLALLTGVPERIARERIRRLRLDGFFSEHGAFGSEVEERSQLLELALRRAGIDASSAVHVGDTSRDVESAQALGLRTIAVAFDGECPARAGAATAAVSTMPELGDALRRLSSSGPRRA